MIRLLFFIRQKRTCFNEYTRKERDDIAVFRMHFVWHRSMGDYKKFPSVIFQKKEKGLCQA